MWKAVKLRPSSAIFKIWPSSLWWRRDPPGTRLLMRTSALFSLPGFYLVFFPWCSARFHSQKIVVVRISRKRIWQWFGKPVVLHITNYNKCTGRFGADLIWWSIQVIHAETSMEDMLQLFHFKRVLVSDFRRSFLHLTF